MVQDQLVDYISSQLKLGVSRDAIKSALVTAGWVAVDVDDTLKKVDGGASATGVVSGGTSTGSSMSSGPQLVTASSPAVTGSAMSAMAKPASGASPMGVSPAANNKPSGPQMIRVSDLVSASPAGSTSMTGSSPASRVMPASSAMGAAAKSPVDFGGKISGNSFKATPTTAVATGGMNMAGAGASAATKDKKGALVAWIVAAVVFLGFGGLAWYFYSGNAGLAAKVSSLTSKSAAVDAQLTSLQSQIAASGTALAAQVQALTAANTDLALDLSFYAVPVSGTGSSTPPTSTAVTISGWLSGGGKAPYAITTPHGAKIFVNNATPTSVMAQLKSFIGDTVEATGMYVPGSDEVTVSTVTNLSPATMTATSTVSK